MDLPNQNQPANYTSQSAAPKLQFGSKFIKLLNFFMQYKLIFVPLFIFLLVIFAANILHDLYATNPRTVTVVGIGKKKVKPEQAIVSFSVVEESILQSDAISRGESKYNDILTSIATFNPQSIDKSTYQVVQRPNNTVRDGRLESASLYQYVNAAKITVTDPASIQNIVRSLHEKGATVVSQVRYIPKDEEKIDKEVRQLAVKDAKERAWEIARNGGAGLGRLITIQEGGSNGETGTAVTGTTAKTGNSVDALGEIEIQALVTVIYELK